MLLLTSQGASSGLNYIALEKEENYLESTAEVVMQDT